VIFSVTKLEAEKKNKILQNIALRRAFGYNL
jgi:hypothetical protein